MITKTELNDNWRSMSGAIKAKYDEITDDELNDVNGSVQRLFALVQQKTGQTRQEVESYLSELCEQQGTTFAQFCATMADYAESARESLRDGYSQVSRQMQRGYDSSLEAVSERPVISVGAALAVGLIAGVAIGLSIASSARPEPTWRDRWTR